MRTVTPGNLSCRVGGSAIMVDGDLTPEQRVHAGIENARFGEIGLGSLGIGDRMGTGGQFVFADLAELDSLTAQWTAERDRIRHDGELLTKAIQLCTPPAEDMMSHYQAKRLKDSLTEAWSHNQAMLNYADGYVQKLEEPRDSMARTERDNVARLHTTGDS
jgi:hypothetical protein